MFYFIGGAMVLTGVGVQAYRLWQDRHTERIPTERIIVVEREVEPV